MSELQAGVNRTEAWIREELDAQRRMLGLLEAQEEAVVASDNDALERTAKEIETALQGGVDRARRRDRILADFGRMWSVSPGTLTLTSIAARADEAGADASRLRRLRGDLRSATSLVLRAGRRIAAHARYHQGLLEELVHVLIASPDEGERPVQGSLVDAEV